MNLMKINYILILKSKVIILFEDYEITMHFIQLL